MKKSETVQQRLDRIRAQKEQAQEHGKNALEKISLAHKIQEQDQQKRLNALKKGDENWQGYNNIREEQASIAIHTGQSPT